MTRSSTSAVAGLVQRLTRSTFSLHLSRLLLLTAAGQGLYLAVAPILTRTVTPADFGLYGLFFAYAATAASFVALFYDASIPAAGDDRSAGELAAGALLATVAMSVLGGSMMSLAVAANLFGLGALPVWSGLLAGLLMLLHGVLVVQQSWRVRIGDPVAVGWSNLSLNVGRGLSQVGFALGGLGWAGLALGEIVGRILGGLHAWRGPTPPDRRPSWRLNWQTMVAYRRFPLVLMPAQLLEAVIAFLHLAVLGLLFGPVLLGQYYLMRRTLDLPLAFATKALSDLFYSRQAEYARNAPERVRPFYVMGFVGLLAVGAVGAAPVVVFGAPLFGLVFGEAWRPAGALAAIMAPAAVMNLAVAPIARVFFLSARPQLRYAFTAAHAVGILTALAVTWRWKLDVLGATACLSAATVASYAIYFVAGYVAAGRIARADDDLNRST